MSDELDKVIAENKEKIIEIIQFWTWMQGLNKVLKWLAIVALPAAVAIWTLIKWAKHQNL